MKPLLLSNWIHSSLLVDADTDADADADADAVAVADADADADADPSPCYLYLPSLLAKLRMILAVVRMMKLMRTVISLWMKLKMLQRIPSNSICLC